MDEPNPANKVTEDDGDAPLASPFESPAAPGPAAGPPPVVSKKQPAWTYFLTPAAVLLGAIIIAASIWWSTGRDNGDPETVVAAAADTSGAVSEAPAIGGNQPSGANDTLLSVFTQYAKAVGMNEQAFQTCLTKQTTVDLINAQYQRGTALGINGTPTFFINNKMIVGSQPLAIFDEIIKAELAGSPTSIDQYSANVRALANTNPPRFQIVAEPPDVSDAVFEGPADAKVIVAEFSDFQCPFCKRFTEETLPALKQTFLSQGVSIAFLHYPITQIHPNAGNASVAAICAAEQGKFWQMHDMLFATQQQWEKLN